MKYKIMRIILLFIVLSVSSVFSNEIFGKKDKQVFSISAAGGMSQSFVRASGRMEDYFAPVDKVVERRGFTPRFTFAYHINSLFDVSTGLYIERRGQKTEETEIKLETDPFLHDFKTLNNFKYATIPLTVKAGYHFEHQWFKLCAGMAGSILLKDSTSWVIDGREINPDKSSALEIPAVNISDSDFRINGGLEYGVIFGTQGVFAGFEYDFGVREISSGLKGKAYNQAWTAYLGFRKYVAF